MELYFFTHLTILPVGYDCNHHLSQLCKIDRPCSSLLFHFWTFPLFMGLICYLCGFQGQKTLFRGDMKATTGGDSVLGMRNVQMQ